MMPRRKRRTIQDAIDELKWALKKLEGEVSAYEDPEPTEVNIERAIRILKSLKRDV